jgi:Bacteriophage tail sheath protein
MTIIQQGSLNTTSLTVPDIFVQIVPPNNNFINGVPSNILGAVGTATWGPVNSPVTVGSMSEAVQNFGSIQPFKYDLMTGCAAAFMQGANNIVCVRVTDGTDTAATAAVLDGSSVTGITLTAFYTGIVGNTINAVLSTGTSYTSGTPTYKLTLAIPGGTPEIFDNIGGTGATFWSNLSKAVNLGQSGIRGPSQLCISTLNNFLSGVTVTTAGSYATLPSFGTTGDGSGATFVGTMKSVSATVSAAGTGYVTADTITLTGGTHTVNSVLTVANTKLASVAVNAGGSNYLVGDTITLVGGTFTTPVVLTVATLSGSGVATVTISNAGSYSVNTASFTSGATSGVGSGATFNTAVWGVNTVTVSTAGAYTALPSSPVAQGATSGSGTSATFTVLWGVSTVAVTVAGSGYDTTSALAVTGGGGTGGATGTLSIGSATAPALSTYTLSGGTSGRGGVGSSQLIGQDTVPRKGMYALRGTGSSVVMLVDDDDSTTYSTQVSYGLSEGSYMIMVGPAGQSISSAISAKQTAGIDSYAAKLLLGDWCYFNDTTNNQIRLISPQGYVAGLLSALSPEQSSLNKQLQGIVGTQTTYANQTYSSANLQSIVGAGLDVVTNPVPGGNYFGVRMGRNTSSNAVINGDNYTRLTNYIAETLNSAIGLFVGQLQTVTERLNAKTTIQTFLLNMQQQGMIGNVNGGPAYSVVLDASNNPNSRVALGYQQADVQIVYLSVISYFIVNIQGGQSVSIQVTSTQPTQ